MKTRRNDCLLRLAAVECNYKEIDRQLKEGFLCGLNDNDIIAPAIHPDNVPPMERSV